MNIPIACPKCGEKDIVLIEYDGMHPDHYDGISEIQCTNKACNARFGRWSGRELKEGETEPPFGKGREDRTDEGDPSPYAWN